MSVSRAKMLETRTNVYRSHGQCFYENSGLTAKANMSVTWVSMPNIKATVPKNQDYSVCYHRPMPETRTMCRFKILKIKANVYRNHGQCFCKFLAKDKRQYVSNMHLEIKIRMSVDTDRC